MTPALENLKVWEERGTTDKIVVDYIGTDYLDKHPAISSTKYDPIIIRGMITQCLIITNFDTPLLQLRSSALFRLLEDFKISFNYHENTPIYDFGILLFPCLERLKRLEILGSDVLAGQLESDLPLVSTLQWLNLRHSAYSWMLGRSFKALREFVVEESPLELEKRSHHEGLQVDLPACTILRLENCSEEPLRFLSCPNVRIFHYRHHVRHTISGTALKCLTNFLCGCSQLQELKISIREELGSESSLVQFVFGDAREQRVWRDIRRVELTTWLVGIMKIAPLFRWLGTNNITRSGGKNS